MYIAHMNDSLSMLPDLIQFINCATEMKTNLYVMWIKFLHDANLPWRWCLHRFRDRWRCRTCIGIPLHSSSTGAANSCAQSRKCLTHQLSTKQRKPSTLVYQHELCVSDFSIHWSTCFHVLLTRYLRSSDLSRHSVLVCRDQVEWRQMLHMHPGRQWPESPPYRVWNLFLDLLAHQP